MIFQVLALPDETNIPVVLTVNTSGLTTKN